MELLIEDPNLTVKEIEKFIEENDAHLVFATRHRNHGNFVKHFEQLMAAKQILNYRSKDGRLTGLVSWVLVNQERKHDINKSRWTLPENISEGDILYIDICLLREGESIFKIKSYLDRKYRSSIKKVFWHNVPGNHTFQLNLKGGTTCPKEQLVAA